MKHEIIELHDVQIIGMAKKGGAYDVDNIVGGHLAFNEAKEECPKFWGEFVEKIVKPIVFENQEPNAFQKAAIDNGVGEFGLCTCDIPNHNCATCWETNFGSSECHPSMLEDGRVVTELGKAKSYQGRVIEPGKVYELSYSECSCPKVKCGLRSNPDQCECSRQSILYILSQLEPDSQFDVRIENTILRGGDRCIFRIARRAGV